jgi:hypothetical protein
MRLKHTKAQPSQECVNLRPSRKSEETITIASALLAQILHRDEECVTFPRVDAVLDRDQYWSAIGIGIEHQDGRRPTHRRRRGRLRHRIEASGATSPAAAMKCAVGKPRHRCKLTPKCAAGGHCAEEDHDEHGQFATANPAWQRNLSGYVEGRQNGDPGNAGAQACRKAESRMVRDTQQSRAECGSESAGPSLMPRQRLDNSIKIGLAVPQEASPTSGRPAIRSASSIFSRYDGAKHHIL